MSMGAHSVGLARLGGRPSTTTTYLRQLPVQIEVIVLVAALLEPDGYGGLN